MLFPRILTTCCTALLLVMFLGCSNAEQKKETHYKRALEYIKLDDNNAAIIELRNAIQLDAKFADARYQLGLLYLKNGDPRGAFAELQRAASLNPENLDAGVKVAEFLLLSRNFDECRKQIESVLTNNPDYVDGLALLANLELIQGNFTKAEEAIDKAITLNDSNDKLFNIKGRLAVAQKKTEEAEQLFKKAITLNPESFANHRALMLFYEQGNNDEGLQKQLDEMIARFPDDPQLYISLASVYQKQEKFDKAEEALKNAINAKKDAVPLRLALANFYKKRNQLDDAKATLTTALTDFPEAQELKIAQADLLFELRDFEGSRKILDEILEKSPGLAGGLLLKARFYIHKQKSSQALDILTPIMKDYPKWSEPFYYAALTQLRLGKIELAQQAIESAVQNDQLNDRSHALAAQIALLRRDSDGAAKEASIAIRLNPRNVMAIKILANSYVQGQDFDKALKLLSFIPEEAVNGDQELLTAKAMAYLGKKDRENATKSFTMLLDMAPENSRTLAMLTALVAGDDIDKAIAFVSDHIKKSPLAGHYLLLGDLYARKQATDEALQAFAKAKELVPNNPMSYVQRGRLFAIMGKAKEAEDEYNQLLAIAPKAIPALMGLAGIAETEGRAVEAIDLYKQVIGLQPNNPAAANNLAWLIASQPDGDLGEALRLAMLAKQALPEQPNVADTLGWIHYKRQSFGLAATQFRQALERRANDPTILYHLALALYGNNDHSTALATLEQALAQQGQFKDRETAKALLQQWKEAEGQTK